MLVSQAFIHASRKERAFHIDSGNTVMHCKALSEADFDRWTDALRAFIGGVVQESAARGGRVASMGGVVDEPDPVDLSTILGAVDGLSKVRQSSLRRRSCVDPVLITADFRARGDGERAQRARGDATPLSCTRLDVPLPEAQQISQKRCSPHSPPHTS